MKRTQRQFDVYPVVVRAESTTRITLKPLDDSMRIDPAKAYDLTQLSRERPAQIDAVPFSIDDGQVAFDATVMDEQEYVFRLDERVGDDRTRIAEFSVYAVREDLYRLRPLKGDFHMHTTHSDGLESPAYVAARCRQIGLDFIAITDHHKYAPSVEAIDAYADTDADLALFPGEEVHPPGNPVHMINFGGSFSVNSLCADAEGYRDAVRRQREAIGDVPAGVDPDTYASTVWALDRIREGGGLAVFCHPYWVANGRYPVDGRLTDHLLAEKPFDAFEVIGGFHKYEVESNALQVARYHDERAKGNDFPIVGLSDSHGCDTGQLFGWYYTLVFAESADLPCLIQAIKDFRSLAVEHVDGEHPRVHGHFRLTTFAHFLLREYFPVHDALCAEEGAAMLDHLAGKPAGTAELTRASGQCTALHARLYGLAP